MFGTKLKYSYTWAEMVTNKLSTAHPRATKIALGKLHISMLQLTLLLAQGRKEYYCIREFVRKLDFWIKKAQTKRAEVQEASIWINTKRLYSALIVQARNFGLTTFEIYLTANKERQIIEEPNTIGAGGGDFGTSPRVLLSDPNSDTGDYEHAWSIDV